MSTRRTSIFVIGAVALLWIAAAESAAQYAAYPPAGYYPQQPAAMYGPYASGPAHPGMMGAMPAGYHQGAYDQGAYDQGAYDQGVNGQMIQPEAYPYADDGSGQYAGDCASGQCGGGAGCGDRCGGVGGFLFHGGPFKDSTCRPHWFDVHAQFMYLKRDEISRQVDFTSRGISGPIVLSTEDLEFKEAAGFRITATYQVGAAAQIEGSYFGTFDWSAADDVTSNTDNLFSVFSNFGNSPANGFPETDEADFHSIEYGSELDSVEMNLRRHWVSPGYWFHGSYLVGVRYVRLEEDFRHITQSSLNNGSADYLVTTNNDLVGFQMGADLFACLLPGLTVGGEVKAGIYGNEADQSTTFSATSINPPIEESVDDDDVALVAEAGAMAIWQIKPWFSVRGGYQFLYLDGVALAPENFNSQPPFLGGTRVPVLNDNGAALYHGFTAGFEYLW